MTDLEAAFLSLFSALERAKSRLADVGCMEGDPDFDLVCEALEGAVATADWLRHRGSGREPSSE